MATRFGEELGIVEAMIYIAGTAKNIYKQELLKEIRICIQGLYVEVESLGLDTDFYDSWEMIKCDNPVELDIARELIHRIKFGSERVLHYSDEVIVYIQDNPHIRRVEEAIDVLKSADFYSEMHQEDEGYSFILKDKNGMRKYFDEFGDVASCYLEDGIYEVYFS